MCALVSVYHPSCGQRPLGFRWLPVYYLSFNILDTSGVRAKLLGCTGDCAQSRVAQVLTYMGAGGLVSEEGFPALQGCLQNPVSWDCGRISVPRFPPLSMGAVS